MTALVWDGKYLYADSMVTGDEMKTITTKAVRVNSPDGPVVVAVAGEFPVFKQVIAAIKAGEPFASLVGNGSTILTVKDGVCTITTRKTQWTEEAPVFLGSGSAAARGAYHVCKSAAKSIAAACAVDLYSGGPIVRLKTS